VTETTSTTALAARIDDVRRRIAEAAERAGRDRGSVTLVAVAKTVDRATVDAAYALGLRHFGENRVQDSVRKYAAPLPPDADLHLIGQLQSNKARPAASLFTIIESVDRPSLIDALDREAARLGRRLPVLLQVNVAGEAQKAGCSVEDAPALAARLLASPGFDLRGMMTIAPLVPDPEQVRPVFAGLRALRDEVADRSGLALPVLSMGMSDDFAVAIAEGATHVRVGRALFAD
jgi:pyridoxal phosphate enzyme (YggS family)